MVCLFDCLFLFFYYHYYLTLNNEEVQNAIPIFYLKAGDKNSPNFLLLPCVVQLTKKENGLRVNFFLFSDSNTRSKIFQTQEQIGSREGWRGCGMRMDIISYAASFFLKRYL